MLDDQDRALLRRFQDDPSLSHGELGDLVGLPAGRVTRRLARMQEEGLIRGVRAVIDWRRLGYAVEVSLRITLEKSRPGAFDAFLVAAREVPEVIEIQTFLGRVDVRLGVVARDLGHYQALYRDRILELPHIAEIEALMTVATVKADEALPL